MRARWRCRHGGRYEDPRSRVGDTAESPTVESDPSYAELCFSTAMTLAADCARDRRVVRSLDEVSHGCRLRHVNRMAPRGLDNARARPRSHLALGLWRDHPVFGR